MKQYTLWYREEAPFGNERADRYDQNLPDDGWEKWSLPLGNSYMGVSVFGRTLSERLQITENSLSNPYANKSGGLNNFCELYLDFDHRDVEHYSRSLDLNRALAAVSYEWQGALYTREYLTSYPDRVLAIKLSCSRPGGLSFTLRPEIPFVKPYLWKEGDGMGKTGTVTAEGDTVTLSGVMEYYQIQYEGQICVLPQGGSMTTGEQTIEVRGADSAVVLMAVGTNYRMESRVFLESDPKKKLAPYPHPHNMVSEILSAAKQFSYEELKSRHLQDYCPLIQRADIDLGGEDPGLPTNELLEHYQKGDHSQYLEELYFQYGRYLLIASSRPGAYPANLQGTWNQYENSPWSAGYWHNINVQMNYWPAFHTNLAELFEPYLDYFKAYLPQAEEFASKYIKEVFPDRHSETPGGDGWIIGTGAWLYTVSGMDYPLSHSGPGTGAFTTKLLWDYYAFTQDRQLLRDTVYPALRSMSRFLTKTLIEQDGCLLVKYSASPEQMHHGVHYHTTGCAFDQQMVYENAKDTVLAAEILGIEDEWIQSLREQMEKLDPVQIGKSGQIKEYREEEYYGEIGDPHHRHISHLIGLCPGTIINSNTPQWSKAAEYSLNARGDESTGWSTAHKINAWARLKQGKRAYDLLRQILTKCTLPNLWDTHPPFQIDGNLGATAGMGEMLLQSHEGFIHVLPAVPEEWQEGSFSGLTARGNFEVSAAWKGKEITKLTVLSKSGGVCRLYLGEFSLPGACDGWITLDTEINQLYSFSYASF